MDTILNLASTALTPLYTLCGRIWAVFPGVVSALILLVVGGMVSYWLRYGVEEIMKAIRIDDYVQRVGLANVLKRLGLGTSLTHVTGVVVFTTIVLAFILGAADAVGLTIVPEYLHRLVAFFPQLTGVTVVMAAGLFLGDIAGRIVFRAAEANRVRGSEALMRMTHGLMVLFSTVLSLEILNIPVRVFLDSMPIILGAIGLGCAIAFGVAFGMAGRDMAGRWIKDLTPRGSSKDAPEERMRVVK